MQRAINLEMEEIPFRQGMDSDFLAPFSVAPQPGSHAGHALLFPGLHRTSTPLTAPVSLNSPPTSLGVPTAHYCDFVAKSWDSGFIELATGDFACLPASAEEEINGKASTDTDGSATFEVALQPVSVLSQAWELPPVTTMSGTVDERYTVMLDSSKLPSRRKLDTGPRSSRATRKSHAGRAVRGNGSDAQLRPPW
jgi:hypothetical protein